MIIEKIINTSITKDTQYTYSSVPEEHRKMQKKNAWKHKGRLFYNKIKIIFTSKCTRKKLTQNLIGLLNFKDKKITTWVYGGRNGHPWVENQAALRLHTINIHVEKSLQSSHFTTIQSLLSFLKSTFSLLHYAEVGFSKLNFPLKYHLNPAFLLHFHCYHPNVLVL